VTEWKDGSQILFQILCASVETSNKKTLDPQNLGKKLISLDFEGKLQSVPTLAQNI
jgi:hypothetical protein